MLCSNCEHQIPHYFKNAQGKNILTLYAIIFHLLLLLIVSEVWPYILTESHQYKHPFLYVTCISHSVWTGKGYMNPTVLIPNFTKANSHKVQMKGQRRVGKKTFGFLLTLRNISSKKAE